MKVQTVKNTEKVQTDFETGVLFFLSFTKGILHEKIKCEKACQALWY